MLNICFIAFSSANGTGLSTLSILTKPYCTRIRNTGKLPKFRLREVYHRVCFAHTTVCKLLYLIWKYFEASPGGLHISVLQLELVGTVAEWGNSVVYTGRQGG